MDRGNNISELDRFIFKLAGHLGMTVADLEDKMSIRELYQWIAYNEVEPLLSDRMEYMLAQLTALLNNINSKKAKPVMDFFVSLDEGKKEDMRMEMMHKNLFADIDKLSRGA